MKTTALLSILAATVLVAHVQAQSSDGAPASAASSKAQRLEWPRTFSGQPDFAFTRDEAVAEGRTRAAKENEPMPLTPSLPDLINDDTELDPLRLSAANNVSSTDDTSATSIGGDVSGTSNTAHGQTLMERLLAESVDLPTITSSTAPDLSEFSAQLSATISSTIANWQPQPGRFNFQGVLQGLVLQAIVTSPLKYAVINQQRYAEGETFRITVPMAVPDSEIDSALMARMPVSGTLPSALMASYQEAYNSIISGFATKRAQTPAIGQQTLVLPVRITAITPRQVQLEVNGQPYALTIRYAY